ncbi:MAG: 30S ribosomal protein S27ae [Candidatus Aenigmarchaeota archaeon]|nr:30S ribosomal protein S27ae [Candidatus Aenigmarchaeota archaeon]
MAGPRDTKKPKKEEAKPVVAAAPKPAAAPKGKAPAPVVEEAPKEEKKKEKKSQKERPHSKKKHTKVQVWKLYKVDGNAIKRKNENCPRCGPGTFLAHYKNRKYCGKCGWSLIQKEEIKK